MKSAMNYFYILIIILLFACESKNAGKDSQQIQNDLVKSNSNDTDHPNGIVGDWQQQFTCFDKNGNYKLEPEEKIPSGTFLGFDWFRFNSDGSCLRDKDIKFEGGYEIKEKNGIKKLEIRGGDNLRYTIAELTNTELILGTDRAFIVFKRIK